MWRCLFAIHQFRVSNHLKGRLGPRVRHVTFFGSKEVGWDPGSWGLVLVRWCFFIKGVPLSLSVDGTCCRNAKMMLQKYWSATIYPPDCILALWSFSALPPVGHLWPSLSKMLLLFREQGHPERIPKVKQFWWSLLFTTNGCLSCL